MSIIGVLADEAMDLLARADYNIEVAASLHYEDPATRGRGTKKTSPWVPLPRRSQRPLPRRSQQLRRAPPMRPLPIVIIIN